jgi:formylglycine-generating enzyme required for sulfatase activity
VDPSQESFLTMSAVNPATPPEQVLIIARAVAKFPSGPELANRLSVELTGSDAPLADRELRAAGLLAWLSPRSEDWSSLGARTARKLSTENVLQIGAWHDVFLPVARTLVEPLRVVEGDRSKPEARDRAYMLLLDFAEQPGNTDRADDLAALCVEADPARLDLIVDRLGKPEERERAARWLSARVADLPTYDDVSAGRQARIAMALARLGSFDAIRSKLIFRADPAVRTELIHEMPRYGIEPLAIASHLRDEPDASVRRALVLSLGEFPPEGLKTADREALITLLERWYQSDPDPGLHGAVDWLLRNRWGKGDAIDQIDRSLASREIPANRGWFLDGQSRSFAIVRGPVTFTMGSSSNGEPGGLRAEEASHLRRIPRSFAIASREVTVAEYSLFLAAKPEGLVDRRGDPQYARVFPSTNCATGMLTWFDALRYCNWLSEREGIPRQQRCYPEKIGPEMTLDPAHLLRSGYRLPTEAEWEFACRAGTSTARFHGNSPARLTSYAWYAGDNRPGLIGLGGTMSPVGQRKPNDLGLFDMLGNAMEWCDSAFLPYPKAQTGQPVNDFSPQPDVLKDSHRVLRGGTFFFSADLVRAASRIAEGPQANAFVIGFRVARTIP